MKAVGILVLLLGLGALGGGISFFVLVARRASEARLIRTVPLPPGPPVKTESFPVATDRKCQLIAEFHRPSKIFEIDSSTLSYRVLDADGAVLAADTVETGTLARLTNEWTGDVQLRHSSSKFDPPKSGKLWIEASLASGGRLSATYTMSELNVYDTVS
ncbi:MAG TPA: hypothetical protein VMU54_04385, partial [Planctomycetota bacterium]|nr:hypothetical protein [Planctomycetota bacterium]